MEFIIWIIVGALAGWIASIIMGTNRQQGLLMDIVVGIIGSFLGGFIFNALGLNAGGGFLGSLIVAIIGAVLLLFIVKIVRRTA
jgi:uncharacterized membrane protein YeaQ/YmgE (transglycosylase-associated protein family)